jgi:hypothetical protein
VVNRFRTLAEVGVQHVIFGLADVWDPRNIETLAQGVLPQAHALEPKAI